MPRGGKRNNAGAPKVTAQRRTLEKAAVACALRCCRQIIYLTLLINDKSVDNLTRCYIQSLIIHRFGSKFTTKRKLE